MNEKIIMKMSDFVGSQYDFVQTEAHKYLLLFGATIYD